MKKPHQKIDEAYCHTPSESFKRSFGLNRSVLTRKRIFYQIQDSPLKMNADHPKLLLRKCNQRQQPKNQHQRYGCDSVRKKRPGQHFALG